MSTKTFFRTGFKWCALVVACMAPLQASFIIATVNNGRNGGACGSVNPIDPAEPCAGGPNLSSVSASAQFSDANGSYDGKALTEYGLNRVYAGSSASNAGVQAASEWMVAFTLTGAPAGTPVDLLVEIGYDVAVSSIGSSEAGFRMVLNNDFFGPFDIYTTTNPFGGDHCFDRPGQTAIGACAGSHSGTVSRVVSASVGPNNRISLLVSAGAFGNAIVDGYSTAKVLGVTVPDGIGWQYQGIADNPLNFQYAGTAPVPEPAAFQLLGAGVAALVFFKRRCRTASQMK